MAKPRSRKSSAAPAEGIDPLVVGLAGLLVISAFCSWRIYSAAGAVMRLAEDKDTYAIFVVTNEDDSKTIKSDNAKLENEVNAGRDGLKAAQAEAVGLMVACGGIATGLAVRVLKTKIR